MGMTLIIAVLGVLLGGGLQFLIGGGIGGWVGVIYGTLVAIIVMASMLEHNGTKLWSVVLGTVIGIFTYYVAAGITNWTFHQVYVTGAQNVWLLALVGGIIADILIGIVVAGLGFFAVMAGSFERSRF